MKWSRKVLAALLAAAMAVTMAAPAFAKTNKNGLNYLDIVDSDGENAYYDNTDTIKPGDKYYIIIGKSTGTKLDNLLDKKLFTFRLKKKDGGKYISGADIVEKRFGNTRYICIEFNAKDNFTDEENKVTLEAIFRAKEDLAAASDWDGTGFPIFEPVTTGVGSSSEVAAKADYEKKNTAYETAKKGTEDAKKAYDDAVAAQTNAADILKAAQTAKTEVENAYPGESVTVKLLQEKANEATTQAANAQKAADLKTAYDNLATAWATWATAYKSYDNNQAREDSTEFQSLKTALTAYQTALAAVTVPEGNASSIGSTTITLELPENFADESDPFSDWGNNEIPYVKVRNALTAPDATDPAQAAVAPEAAFVNALTTYYGDPADLQAKATAYSTDAEKLKKAEETLANSAQNSGEDLAALEAAWKKAQTDEAAAKAAMDSAHTRWQSILNGTSSSVFLKDGDEYSFEFTVWVQNERQEDDDANFVAGEKGVVIRPVKNETNTITWENSDRTLARLTFQADSDTDYLCPRLSTRWSNEDYRNFFDDQDAYLLDFVSNPDIPAQTRGTLELYNPFLDRDGDYYRDVRDLYLYQAVDGILKEVDFDPVRENDDGEQVLRLRTRTLGTYVICEDPLDLDDLYGDEDKDNNKKPSRPSDANKPDIIIDANQKPVPNTGR